MKFSGKMRFKIILKVTKKKKQGFTISLEDTFFEKPQVEVKLTTAPSLPSSFTVNIMDYLRFKHTDG